MLTNIFLKFADSFLLTRYIGEKEAQLAYDLQEETYVH